MCSNFEIEGEKNGSSCYPSAQETKDRMVQTPFASFCLLTCFVTTVSRSSPFSAGSTLLGPSLPAAERGLRWTRARTSGFADTRWVHGIFQSAFARETAVIQGSCLFRATAERATGKSHRSRFFSTYCWCWFWLIFSCFQDLCGREKSRPSEGM